MFWSGLYTKQKCERPKPVSEQSYSRARRIETTRLKLQRKRVLNPILFHSPTFLLKASSSLSSATINLTSLRSSCACSFARALSDRSAVTIGLSESDSTPSVSLANFGCGSALRRESKNNSRGMRGEVPKTREKCISCAPGLVHDGADGSSFVRDVIEVNVSASTIAEPLPEGPAWAHALPQPATLE